LKQTVFDSSGDSSMQSWSFEISKKQG